MWIKCSDLDVTFLSANGEVEALHGVNFEARPGEFLSIIGPSGCGKTTLLRALAGLTRPSAGSIERIHTRGESTDRILLVFQENSLFPWMTVLENAVFGLEMQGVERTEREQRALELLSRFGIVGRERAYPHELSLGMKQRVAVIRCFLSDPAVLLMDEPFAALDAMTRLELQQELLNLWEQNHRTVVFVTHDVDEAILLSDRILVLGTQPGTIISEFPVPFERPRGPQMTLTAEFLALKRQLYEQLGMRSTEALHAT
jgi:NitT/TauT family transport system ATP-binding protein